MTDIRVPGNAVPPIEAVYAAFYGVTAGETPADAPVWIVAEAPGDWDVTANPPLIVVSDDSGPTIWPVWTEPLIRTTVYANGKQTAIEMRRLLTGVLMASVPNGMHIRKTGLGYTEGRDPDTGADLASFTVNATVRTEVITVSG